MKSILKFNRQFPFFLFIGMFLLVACGQNENKVTSKPTTDSTASPVATTTPEATPVFTQASKAQELKCGNSFIRSTDGRIWELRGADWTHIGDQCKSLECRNGTVACISNDNSVWIYQGTPFQWKAEAAPTPANSIIIESFSQLPPEIDGAGCRYAPNAQQYKNGVFVFADDGSEIGYIKINGEMIKMKFGNGKDLNKTTYQTTYSNDVYNVTIVSKSGKNNSADGVDVSMTGTITVKNKKTGQTGTATFYGACGA